MKIREFRLQKGIFIYKVRISFTKVDFYLQNGSFGLQMGLSFCYSPKWKSIYLFLFLNNKYLLIIDKYLLTFVYQHDILKI